MASTAHTSLECEDLHSYTSPIPHGFPSTQAELVHVNEKISSFDNHISQSKSRQLHNLLLPIHTLPIEVLARIFQQTTDREDYYCAKFKEYRKCLHQAFVLSSVSALFRKIAFGTPELWQRVPLCINDVGSIDRVSSLLQHCMALAANIKISVTDGLVKNQARCTIEILLTSDVTRKIKAFDLNSSTYASNLWVEKLKGPSFPILDALDITCGVRDLNIDLGSLNTVTRFKISDPYPGWPVIPPPSVRYLHLHDVPQQVFVPMLYQCPNLEECYAVVGSDGRDWSGYTEFEEPLTLTHLKRLTLGSMNIVTEVSVKYLVLLSLEYLQFEDQNSHDFIEFFFLCCNVSATLTTFKIHIVGWVFNPNLYHLCELPFHSLRKLRFAFTDLEPMLGAIRALTERAEECSKAQLHYLPSLTTFNNFALRWW